MDGDQSNIITLPPHITSASPSARDGVLSDIEMIHRSYGISLISEAQDIMILDDQITCSAQTLLHRFFFRKSLTKFDVFTVAMGCVLLATKLEEKPKLLRDIILCFYKIYQARRGLTIAPIDVGGPEYNTWKSELIIIERYILKELGFSFYRLLDEHPYARYQQLKKEISIPEDSDTQVVKFLLIAMRSVVCVQKSSAAIVQASLLQIREVLPVGALQRLSVSESEVQEVYNAVNDSRKILPCEGWLAPLREVEYLMIKEAPQEVAAEQDGQRGRDSDALDRRDRDPQGRRDQDFQDRRDRDSRRPFRERDYRDERRRDRSRSRSRDRRRRSRSR